MVSTLCTVAMGTLFLLLNNFAVLSQPSIHLLFPIWSDVSVAMLTVPMEGTGAVPVYVGLTCNQFTKGDVLAIMRALWA